MPRKTLVDVFVVGTGPAEGLAAFANFEPHEIDISVLKHIRQIERAVVTDNPDKTHRREETRRVLRARGGRRHDRGDAQ